MIYFVQAGDEPVVKIGHSADIGARVRDLQVAHWRELQIIRAIEGGQPEERWLHKHFAGQRIRLEWFHLIPEMLTIEPPAVVAISDANHVTVLIQLFGGTRPMAKKVGVRPGSIQHWEAVGRVPLQRVAQVRAAAKAEGFKLKLGQILGPHIFGRAA